MRYIYKSILLFFLLLGLGCILDVNPDRINPYDPLAPAEIRVVFTNITFSPEEVTNNAQQTFDIQCELISKYEIVTVQLNLSNIGRGMTNMNKSQANSKLWSLSGLTVSPETTMGDQTIQLIAENENNFTRSTNANLYVISKIPTLTYPADGTTISNTKPTFEWIVIESADSSDIQLSDTTNFDSPIAESLQTTQTNWTCPVILSNNSTYYVRIRSTDPEGNSSWGMISFYVNIGEVSLLSPADILITNSRPTLQWTDPEQAVNYWLMVDNNSDFSSAEMSMTNTSSSQMVSGAVNENITNYWKVALIDTNNVLGDWSATRTFILDTQSPSLSILTPTNNQWTTNINIDVTGTASDNFIGVAAIYISADSGVYQTANGTYAWTNNLTFADGVHYLDIFATDGLGNTTVTNRITNIQIQTAVYVSTSGIDTKSGMIDDPLLTVTTAVSNAKLLGLTEVKVGAGSYVFGRGLENIGPFDTGVLINDMTNLTLSGGWNSDYSAISGYSVFDATNSNVQCLRIDESYNIKLNNLAMINANRTGTGGGLVVYRSSNVVISNCIITNNASDAQYSGAGVFVYESTNCSILYSDISYNNATYMFTTGAGGILLDRGNNYTIDRCSILSNEANYGAGIYVLAVPQVNILTNELFDYVGVDANKENNSVIHINNNDSFNMSGLNISGNDVAGSNTVLIMEEPGFAVNNHTLIDNSFYIFNNASYVYEDTANGFISNTTDINNSTKTGADTASGNDVINNDSTPPTISFDDSSLNNGVISETNLTISGTASDSGSGVKKVSLQVDTGTLQLLTGTTNWTQTISLSEGVHDVHVYAEDYYGNIGTNSLNNVTVTLGIYVSLSGNDTNSGFKTSPLRTIQNGLDKAAEIGVSDIFVQSGQYSIESGLAYANSFGGAIVSNHNLKLSGGWSGDFSSLMGKSVVDPGFSYFRGITIKEVTNIRIENFVIRDGDVRNSTRFGSAGPGGGIFLSNASYCYLSNMVLSNNFAYNGGAIAIFGGTSNLISGKVIGNSTDIIGGGGIFVSNSSHNQIMGVYSNNSGKFGGAVHLNQSPYNSVSGTIVSNYSSDGGGGLALISSHSNDIGASFISNLVEYPNSSYGGGAIFMENSYYNSISGQIFRNLVWNSSMTCKGGGIKMIGSHWNTISSSIISNEANADWAFGGGIALSNCMSNTINGDILYNIATNKGSGSGGGGIIMETSTNNTISSLITGNLANGSGTAQGGGIYMVTSSALNTINGIITNNTANDQAGGLYIDSSSPSNDYSSATISDNDAAQDENLKDWTQ